MKSLLVLAFIVTVVAFSANAVAEEKAYVPKQNEELFGTWVNPDYEGGGRRHQKKVVHPDGRYERFSQQWQKEPSSRFSYKITDKWTDPEGNTWYKFRQSNPIYEYYKLCRISNSGKTWESVHDTLEYPTKIDPENTNYQIYYRK